MSNKLYISNDKSIYSFEQYKTSIHSPFTWKIVNIDKLKDLVDINEIIKVDFIGNQYTTTYVIKSDFTDMLNMNLPDKIRELVKEYLFKYELIGGV